MIIDMDGVIWRGSTILPYVHEFFQTLRGHDIRFVLATNNATASPTAIQEHLASTGIEIRVDEILTSAMATAHYLSEELDPATKVLAIGAHGLISALEDRGIELTDSADSATAVVVGMDRQLCWSQMAEACLALNAGASFIGTNPDVSFPTERGQVPGNGATLAALKAASGREPLVIGKPEPHLYRQAMDQLQVSAEGILVVGDRLETDILGGIRLGVPTLLLLTGVTGRAEAEASQIQPDYIAADLSKVIAWLQAS
jgi:4-nitrophenyl phosphatase